MSPCSAEPTCMDSRFRGNDDIRLADDIHGVAKLKWYKDSKALWSALRNSVVRTYELITLYECYAVDSSGGVIVLENAIKRNEDALKARYKIAWPTKRGYSHRQGESEIDRGMEKITGELGLQSKRIKGWERIELSDARRKTRAYLDCALFRIQTSR